MRKTGLAAIAACAVFCVVRAAEEDFSSYVKVRREEVKDIGAFSNGDFEEHARFGKVGQHAELGSGFGYNGNGGCRVWPLAKNYSHRFPISVELERGRKYLFTVYVRRHNKAWAMPAWESYVDGKYSDNCWGCKRTPMDGGWEKCEVQVMPKTPGSNIVHKLFLYCGIDGTNRADWVSPENYIDCDNVSLKDDLPDWYFVNTWPTHNKLFNEEGRIRFSSTFVGPYIVEDADPVYELKVAAGGETFARQTVSATKDGVLTVAFGPIGYKGPATLVTTLYDRKNKLNAGTKEIPIFVTPTYRPKTGEVFIQENGRVLVDGKPFMPLGFFTGFNDRKLYPDPRKELPEHLKRLREAGFNTLVEYSTFRLRTPEDRDWFYSTCASNSIRVLPNDFGYWTYTDFKQQKSPELRAKIRTLADYPAVLGWFTMDEATYDKIPALEWLRRTLNEEAPGHVAWPCNILDPGPFLCAGDVQGGDHYPIGKANDLSGMDESVRIRLSYRPAAAWYAPQCYNWATMKPGPTASEEAYRAGGREPQENEMLSVALLHASHGVNGFLFYSYFDIPRCPVKEWIPQRWENMRNVAKALKSLEPFITSGEVIEEISHEEIKGASRIVALSDGHGHHRVLVIGLKDDNEATFILPVAWAKLNSRYGKTKTENGIWRFIGRDFSCDILE